MLQSYAPKDVVITWNGVPITGFSSGTFVTVKRNEDSKKFKVGARGEMCTIMNANRSGQVGITLMQTSPSNNALALLLNAEEIAKKPTVGVLTISDPSGSSLALARNAVLKSFPSSDLGDDATDREWMWECEDLDYQTAIGFIPDSF